MKTTLALVLFFSLILLNSSSFQVVDIESIIVKENVFHFKQIWTSFFIALLALILYFYELLSTNPIKNIKSIEISLMLFAIIILVYSVFNVSTFIGIISSIIAAHVFPASAGAMIDPYEVNSKGHKTDDNGNLILKEVSIEEESTLDGFISLTFLLVYFIFFSAFLFFHYSGKLISFLWNKLIIETLL